MRYPIEFYKSLKIGQEIFFVKGDYVLKERIRRIKISEWAILKSDNGKFIPKFEDIDFRIEISTYGKDEVDINESNLISTDLLTLLRHIEEDFERKYSDESEIS